MTSFGSISDILDGTAHRRPEKKPLEPLRTGGGDILVEEDVYRLPGEGRPAVIEDGQREDPFRGKRCAVRKCKQGVQLRIQERLDDDFGVVEPDPFIPSGNPLTVQIEAAVNAVRPAVLVPFSEPVLLCLTHYHEFMDARNARIAQEREVAKPASWHLSEIDWPNASIRIIDGDWFELSDGERVMKLEIAMHLREATARLQGKEWRQEVLTPEQRRLFVLKTKFPNGDVPEAAKAATTFNTIKG